MAVPSFGSTFDVATAYARAGLSVVAIKPDGSKRPPFTWAEFEHRHATERELRLWFGAGRNGIGVICGAISGGLEVIDFDCELFAQWQALVESVAPGLVDRLPCVLTPGGGVHVFYRCATITGNQKLAQTVGKDRRPVTLIETRGEGGLVVAPGSPPTCHPTRKPYQLAHGDLRAIPEIAPGERDALLSAARAFNEYVAPQLAVRAPGPRQPADTQRPGDAYTAATTWAEVLEPHGWCCVALRGDVGCWKRPGKDSIGWSATTNHADSDLLYVFSSNAAPFEPERSYDRFAAYAFLEHGGDFRAAAQALADQGYGEPARAIDLSGKPEKAKGQRWIEIEVIGADALMQKQFPIPRYAVSELLPEGLSILSGKPKQGKSWLVLGIALSVASGAPALGKIEVEPGEVLYMALEDGQRRLQRRLNELLSEASPPAALTFATKWPAMDDGGLAKLRGWLEAHARTRLVVIDTFTRFRPEEKRGAGIYSQDYKAVAPLADLAHDFNISIVIVMHNRKMESEDPMDLVSGSLGLSGAGDGVLVMKRERGSADAMLHVFDRDQEDKTVALRWNIANGGWLWLGDAEQYKRSQQRNEVLAALHDFGPSTPRELAERMGRNQSSIRRLLWEIHQAGLTANAGGTYMPLAPRPDTVPSFLHIGEHPEQANTPNATNRANT